MAIPPTPTPRRRALPFVFFFSMRPTIRLNLRVNGVPAPIVARRFPYREENLTNVGRGSVSSSVGRRTSKLTRNENGLADDCRRDFARTPRRARTVFDSMNSRHLLHTGRTCDAEMAVARLSSLPFCCSSRFSPETRNWTLNAGCFSTDATRAERSITSARN